MHKLDLTHTFLATQPMLLAESSRPFSDPSWGFELKFDGHRALACCSYAGVQLKSRQGTNTSSWFPEIVQSLSEVRARNLILDGEICVLDEIGRSDFDRLQARARKRRFDPSEPTVFCVFDVLVSQGKDVMSKPLLARKRLLEQIRGLPRVLIVDQIPEQGEALFRKVLELQLEGLVAKRMDSTYQPGVRSHDWLKIKRPGAVPQQRFKRVTS